MKDNLVFWVIGGLVIMSGSLFSIHILSAQEVAPVVLPIQSPNTVESDTEESVEKMRQQTIRQEQLQRQRFINQSEESPVREESVQRNVEVMNINSQEREERIRARCELVSSNIQQHQNRFTNKSDTRITVYTKIVTRLQGVSTRLSETGTDVSQLNNYITDIQGKLSTLEDASNLYSQSLKTDSTELCSQDNIKTVIDTKKQELQSIIAQDRAIRQIIRETVVPYLKSLRPASSEPSISQ